MLFRKDIEPRCAYCAKGAPVQDGQVACTRCGIVPEGHKCRHFEYDPLRRVPPTPAAPDFTRFRDEDFSL